MKDEEDFLLTALSNKGNLVGYYTSIKNSIQKAQEAHKMNLISSAVFARAMCATVLLSGNLKNKTDRFSISWNCSGPAGRIYLETDYTGNVCGFIENNNLQLIENSLSARGDFSTEPYIGFGELIVSRDSFKPYRSIVVIETGEIAQDISFFLEQSLQIQSAINIGLSITKENKIESAGGILLMGLPGISKEEVEVLHSEFQQMTNLNEILSNGKEDVLEFFQKLGLDCTFQKRNIQFSCHCNEEKIKKALKILAEEKLEEYLNEDKMYEVKCQYCGKEYKINTQQLEKNE